MRLNDGRKDDRIFFPGNGQRLIKIYRCAIFLVLFQQNLTLRAKGEGLFVQRYRHLFQAISYLLQLMAMQIDFSQQPSGFRIVRVCFQQRLQLMGGPVAAFVIQQFPGFRYRLSLEATHH
jgi:hypothetical protein